MSTLDDRLDALAREFAPLPGVLVAFSGGVDSGVVLAAAVRALGADRVVAATAVSPSLPAAELADAAAFAASLGVRHEFPRTDELSREGYGANAGDRCAFCKSELVDVLTPLAARLGIADVVTGTNADDLRAGFRPGIRAAAERGAWAPLARAGMTKDDVRAARPALGSAAGRQAGRRLPGQPDRLRRAGHPPRASRGSSGPRPACGGAGRRRPAGAEPAGARPGRRRRAGGGRRRAGRRPGRAGPSCSAAVAGLRRRRGRPPRASGPGR